MNLEVQSEKKNMKKPFNTQALQGWKNWHIYVNNTK